MDSVEIPLPPEAQIRSHGPLLQRSDARREFGEDETISPWPWAGAGGSGPLHPTAAVLLRDTKGQAP